MEGPTRPVGGALTYMTKVGGALTYSRGRGRPTNSANTCQYIRKTDAVPLYLCMHVKLRMLDIEHSHVCSYNTYKCIRPSDHEGLCQLQTTNLKLTKTFVIKTSYFCLSLLSEGAIISLHTYVVPVKLYGYIYEPNNYLIISY